jgi:hypothetical protein
MLNRTRAVRAIVREWAWPGWLIGIVYMAIGITLVLQPDRYYNTPSYGILLQVMAVRTWGVLYIVAALSLLGYAARFHGAAYASFAHVIASALTLFWLAAFVIRYTTDPGTTIVNVASWTTYLAVIFRSAFLIDGSRNVRVGDVE